MSGDQQSSFAGLAKTLPGWLADPYNVFVMIVVLLPIGALAAGVIWGAVSWTTVLGQVLATLALLGFIGIVVFGAQRFRRRRHRTNDQEKQ